MTSGSRSQEVAILFLANFSPPGGSGVTVSKEEQFCLLLSDSPHSCRSMKEMKELMVQLCKCVWCVWGGGEVDGCVWGRWMGVCVCVYVSPSLVDFLLFPCEQGKQIIEVKAVLVKKGYIQALQMKDVAEEYANDPNKAHLQACRLLKPYRGLEEVEAESLEDEEESVTGGNPSCDVHVTCFLFLSTPYTHA